MKTLYKKRVLWRWQLNQNQKISLKSYFVWRCVWKVWNVQDVYDKPLKNKPPSAVSCIVHSISSLPLFSFPIFMIFKICLNVCFRPETHASWGWATVLRANWSHLSLARDTGTLRVREGLTTDTMIVLFTTIIVVSFLLYRLYMVR